MLSVPRTRLEPIETAADVDEADCARAAVPALLVLVLLVAPEMP